MIIYFSGTGNSRYAAKFIASQLGDEFSDAGILMKTGEEHVFESERPWVFVAPTYAWRMPTCFEDFLRHCTFSGSKEAYFILTCGGHIGGAGKKNSVLCDDLDLIYRGTLQVIMPNNYIIMSNTPSEEESSRIIAASRPVLRAGAEVIRSGSPIQEVQTGFGSMLKTTLINSMFYKFAIKPGKFTASENCTGCGKCEVLCPLNNITIENGMPFWSTNCTNCMACISSCPQKAIEYGSATKNRIRYVCPEYGDNCANTNTH